MTGKPHIDYNALAQEALRGIVRKVLLSVATSGLPGEHHFFIAFDTRVAGVVVSRRLKERYPEEMTIVLQHQFDWLTVTDDRFEVTLSFDNVPERLTVPLKAVRKFFDPSVPFVLQFEGSDLAGDEVSELDPQGAGVPELGRRREAMRRPGRDVAAEPARKLEKLRGPHRAAKDNPNGESAAGAQAEASGPAGGSTGRRRATRPKLVKPKSEQPANDANVIHIDQFRKK
jgi:uncharacterized protein